jgi:hypothetical protein
MSFVLDEYPYHADILCATTRRVVGRVYIPERPGPLPVSDDQGRFIFAVERLDEAAPKFEQYHSTHEPQWQSMYLDEKQQGSPLLILKRTLYGELRVEQGRDGSWRAYRNGLPLLRGSWDATFNSCREAQEAAERHVTDYFYIEYDQPASDGLRWVYDWKVDGDYLDRWVDRVLRDCPGA